MPGQMNYSVDCRGRRERQLENHRMLEIIGAFQAVLIARSDRYMQLENK